MELLDIKSDYIFKQVFGIEKNKDLLISLLNAILQGKPEIKTIELRNTDITKILKDNKSIRLDVKAQLNDNTYVDIEIQCDDTQEIPERAVHYLSQMVTENSKKDEDYKHVKVIGIWILGKKINNRKAAINEALMNYEPNEYDKTYERLTDKTRLIFIELPKFQPKNLDKKHMLDVWMAFLKEPMNAIDIKNVPEVDRALSHLKYVSADDDIREIYKLRERTIHDQNSAKIVAVEKALAEGEAIGIEKGAMQAKLETAKNFLKMGLTTEQVALGTGLSIEEVEQLK